MFNNILQKPVIVSLVSEMKAEGVATVGEEGPLCLNTNGINSWKIDYVILVAVSGRFPEVSEMWSNVT